MTLLTASMLALLLGPLLAQSLGRHGRSVDWLNWIAFAAVIGFIFLHVLPESIGHGLLQALAFLGLGLVVPTAMEQLLHRFASKAHGVTLWLSMGGLAIHNLFDGAALASGGIESVGGLLPLAIIIHRVPVGLMAWTLVRESFGVRSAATVIGVLLAATVCGYLLGVQLQPYGETPAYGWFQALVAGALLHIVLHRPHEH